jgi:hypothetical protein
LRKSLPVLRDHGVPEHDVFNRVTESEYDEFLELILGAAKTARKAYDSNDINESISLWREIFGKEFPKPPEDKGGYSERTQPSIVTGGRFA